MSSYNPPSENLPTFNPAVFSDNFTPDQVDSKIKTLETEMDAQQLKTTRIEFDSSSNETTITGTTLDVDATLELPNHSDVDTTLTNINTKLTGISYSSGNDETDIDTNSGNFKLSIQNKGIKIEGDPDNTDTDIIPLQGQTVGGSVQIRLLNRLGTSGSANYHLYTNNFQRDSTDGFNIINDSFKAQKLECYQPAIGDSDATSLACNWAFYSSTSANPSPAGEVKFYYDGDVEANNVVHTSDKRLKENIIDAKTDNLISDFQKIRFVNYNYIGKERKELGVIGQELQEIYPSLVVERKNAREDRKEDELETYLSVKYGVLNIKGLMVVQELIKKVESLEQRIKELEK